MPVGPGFDIFTRLIVGREAERKSREIQLNKRYEPVAEWLKTVKICEPERYPTAPCCPPPGRRSSEPSSRIAPGALDNCHSAPLALPPRRKEPQRVPGLELPGRQLASPPALTLESPQGETFPGARSPSEEFLKRSYQTEDRKTKTGRDRYFDSNGMPYLPALKGLGRYRMAVDADEEHQLSVLHRSMLNLDAHTVKQCDLDLSGIDKELVEKYKAIRLESQHGYEKGHTKCASRVSEISVDTSRDCPVTRGFSSSVSTHIASSRGRPQVCQQSSPLTSYNSSAPNANQHKSSAASASVNNASGAGPLTTAAERSQHNRSKWRQCIFDYEDTECAVISDDADSEDEWYDVIEPPGTCPPRSLLTQQLAQIRRKPNQTLRPKLNRGSDRSKTARGAQRPAIRRATSRDSDAKWREVQSVQHKSQARKA